MTHLLKRAVIACALLLGMAFASPALARAPDCTTATTPNTLGTTANAQFEMLAKICGNSNDPTNPGRDVGSASFSPNCTTLTLPSVGGTFAIGDLAGNNATAGSVTPQACGVARYSGGPITITRANLFTSATGLSGAIFRIHFYLSAPTFTNGNDGAYLTTYSGEFCQIDVALTQAYSNGTGGWGTPTTGSTCTQSLSATATVYTAIESRTASVWTAAQTFTARPEGLN